MSSSLCGHVSGVQRSWPVTSAVRFVTGSLNLELADLARLVNWKGRGSPDSDSLHWDCRWAAVFNSFYLFETGLAAQNMLNLNLQDVPVSAEY